jgi:carboxyl-terminal processing protease
VTVIDEKLEEMMSELLVIPVAGEGPARVAASGAARVTAAQGILRTGASQGALPIAVAKQGAVLPVNGRVGDFVCVEWQKGRHAFASASDVELLHGGASASDVELLHGGAKPAGGAVEVWQRRPPRIALAPDPAQGAPVVTTDKIRIQGTATVSPGVAGTDTKLRDLFIFANDQKVFFKVVPEAAGSSKFDFAVDVPLKPGNNVITVFAREDEEFQSRRSLFVYRRGPAEVAAQQSAPRGNP